MQICLKKALCVYASHLSVPYGCKMFSSMLKWAETFKHEVHV